MTTSAEHETELTEAADNREADELEHRPAEANGEQADEAPDGIDEAGSETAEASGGRAGLADDEALEKLRELVSFIAESLVDEPDEVRVAGATEDGQLRLELTVSPDDVGKVIGREGRTARAMRTLLATTGAKMRRRVNLQILE